jgi:hypothetical protein
MISHQEYLKYMEWAEAQGELLRNSKEARDEFLDVTGLREILPELRKLSEEVCKEQERDKKIKAIISSNSCPHCGQHLLPEE